MKPVLEASVPVTLEDVFTGSTKRIRVKRRGTDPPPTPDDPQRLRTGRPGVRPAAVLVLPKGLPAAPVRLEILTKCISMAPEFVYAALLDLASCIRCSWPATAATDAAGSPAASASLVRVWGNARRPPSQGDGDDFVLLVVACLIGSCSRSTRCEEPVLEVRIQPGLEDGSVVACQTADGRPRRDVVGVIRVKPHPHFSRQGEDLHIAVQIPLADALTGGAARLQHLDGRELLVCGSTKVIKPGSCQQIRGEGMPKPGSSQRGDLYVHFEVAFPDTLDSAGAKELMAALQRAQRQEGPEAGAASPSAPREQSRL
ncbi:ERDJ3B [Symbiodinium natans]|uniref:ERDJ3B protein n=1 Tax=Symbiodinium natans TaxID=878477 RepID=A0A812S8Y9_9DINO|nr:ERDJ3B [Symbiodinium natans]